jgi:hypothetical protein
LVADSELRLLLLRELLLTVEPELLRSLLRVETPGDEFLELLRVETPGEEVPELLLRELLTDGAELLDV